MMQDTLTIPSFFVGFMVAFIIWVLVEGRKSWRREKFTYSFKDANEEAAKQYPDDKAQRDAFIRGAAFREESHLKH